MAFHNSLHVLRIAGRIEEFETMQTEFLKRFANDRDPAIRMIVSSACENAKLNQ